MFEDLELPEVDYDIFHISPIDYKYKIYEQQLIVELNNESDKGFNFYIGNLRFNIKDELTFYTVKEYDENNLVISEYKSDENDVLTNVHFVHIYAKLVINAISLFSEENYKPIYSPMFYEPRKTLVRLINSFKKINIEDKLEDMYLYDNMDININLPDNIELFYEEAINRDLEYETKKELSVFEYISEKMDKF